MMRAAKKHLTVVLLMAILLIAVYLRLYGIDFGRPCNYHPDETKLVTQAGRLLATKFMDKDAYFGIGVYPPFHTYLLAMVMGACISLGLLSGRIESLAVVKALYEAEPFQFFLQSRLLVAAMGALSVLIIYLIGKRIYSQKIGLLSSLFLAVNFLHVRNSHFGTVDVPAAFWGLLCIYFCVRIMQAGAARHYIGAAVFAALSVATKFSMVMLVFPVFFAHFAQFPLRQWLRKIGDKKLWSAAAAGVVSFLIACPLVWLDFHETWGGILGTRRFEKVGKIGSGGGFLSYWTGDQSDGFGVFYPNSIPETFGLLLTLAAAVGLIYLLMKHRRQDLFILVCTVPMYLLFEKMSIKAMRHILPIIPFLLLAASVLIWETLGQIRPRVKVLLLSLILTFFSLNQAFAVLDYHRALAQKDPRTAAAEWFGQHVPQGSAAAVESFPPMIFTRDDGYQVYETNWTSKSRSEREKFFTFAAGRDSLYYVADDFTRQVFQWKYTQRRHPLITEDRLEFFAWLDKHMKKLVTFTSKNPKIQPTITVYLITEIDKTWTMLNKMTESEKQNY
ncbi:glycosyltransferase family 39 protein [candidate division KSB1 bacterium]|nr:glycosyltransferase family 39 protein [candidate division KSB1 bacterium]RQW01914.1 MAG: phospholipid carrier-dependent glycosyltransferase [candidate division KSB1 bacterium]